MNSDSTISEYLHYLTSKTKLSKDSGSFEHPWGSIRRIARRTGLHHNTVRKTIERLKERKEVIEMYGKNNARLFTPIDSANADYIKTKCKLDPKFRKWLEKINSKDVLKEFKKNRSGDPIYPIRKYRGYENRVRAKERKQYGHDMKRFSDIFTSVIEKRHLISVKNRRHFRRVSK